METANVLRRFNLGIVVAISPFEIRPFLRIHDAHDCVLVKRPRVHVGVETKCGNRTEEEGFARFPRLAGRQPSQAACIKTFVARVGHKGVDGGKQFGILFFKLR